MPSSRRDNLGKGGGRKVPGGRLHRGVKRSLPLQPRVFLFALATGSATLFLVGLLFAWQITIAMEERIGAQAMDIARLSAARADVIAAYSLDRPETALQPIAESIRQTTEAAFVVFMNMEGIRYSHPRPDLIGQHFTGGDEGPALQGKAYTSKTVGVSGPSIRALVPIVDTHRRQVGVVAVGFFQPEIAEILHRVYYILYISAPIGLMLTVVFSYYLSRSIKQTIFGLEPVEIATLLQEKEAMLQSIREGIVAINRKGQIALMNHSAKQLLGITEDVVGQPIRSVVPFSRLPDVMLTRMPEFDQRYVSGEKVFLVNHVPLIVNDEVVGALATFRDLTEINKLAVELTDIRRVLAALRARSHEFVNKLHVISGLLQLGSYAEAIAFINSTTLAQQNLLSFLINRIRDAPTLGLLLGKASEASEKGVRFQVDERSYLSHLPEGFDEGALTVVLGNLIDNAIEAVADMPAHRRSVTVLVQQTSTHLVISVYDMGAGIPGDISDLIFERGFSTKGCDRGHGLANVAERVRLAEGRIECKSTSGGTTFTVTIPYNRPA